MSEEIILIKKGLGEGYVRVLEDAGATPQEWARFAHLAKRSPIGALAAILLLQSGNTGVAEVIDSCAEVARRRAQRP